MVGGVCERGAGVLCVPGAMVGHLCDGLRLVLGFASEDIARVSRQRSPCRGWGAYREAFGRLDRARVLLDEMGWCVGVLPAGVRVDMGVHGAVVLDAFHSQLLAEIES